MMRERATIAIGAAAIFALLHGCGPGEYDLLIRFSPPSAATSAERIEVVLVPSCTWPGAPTADPVDVVQTMELRRGALDATLGEVPPGPYGLAGRAFDASDAIVATGCEEVALVAGGSDTLVLVLDAIGCSGCAADEECIAGVCTPIVSGCTPIGEHVVSDPLLAVVRPLLAFSGDGWGVAYEVETSASAGPLHFAALDSRGTRLGDDVVVTALAASGDSDMVWSDAAYGVSFNAPVSPAMARLVRLDAAGTLLTGELEVATTTGDTSLVWTVNGFGLAHTSRRGSYTNIYLARLDPLGAFLSEEMLTNEAGSSVYPQLAWTGSDYGVAYVGARGSSVAVFLRRAGTDAVPLADELVVSILRSGGAVRLAGGEAGFAMTWLEDDVAYLARFDRGGVPIGAVATLPSGPSDSMWTGDRYVFAWVDDAAGDAFVASIGEGDAAPSAPVRVSSDAAEAHDPVSLAFDGSGYAVVWSDTRSGTNQVYFASVCEVGP